MLERRAAILAANGADCEVAAGRLDEGTLDRLRLDEERVESLARQLEATAALPPLEREVSAWPLPNGLRVSERRVWCRSGRSARTSRPGRTSRSTWRASCSRASTPPCSGREAPRFARSRCWWTTCFVPVSSMLASHDARHTFASLMIAAGVNARALTTYMGHASVTVTYDLYGHLMPGNESEAAALLDAYLERANTQARLAALED